jgi:hypothetical protein
MDQAIEKGVRATLLANGTISAAVGTRIYALQAPNGATLPYIILSSLAGGEDNDTSVQSGDFTLVVRAVSDSASGALSIANAIYGVLHEVSLTLDAPYLVARSQRVAPVLYPENTERVTYYHRGGIYRIRPGVR